MATHLFLALDGVDGESTDDRHRGEIELESWAFGVSGAGTVHLGGGGGAGKATLADLSVTKRLDLATPALLQAAAAGTRLRSATLTARRPGAGREDYLVVVLTSAFVTRCQVTDDESVGGPDGRPLETVQLSYDTVRLTYTGQSADGGAGPSRSFGWDVRRNAPL